MPLTFEELVALVGQDRYRAACDWAWRTAVGTGSSRDLEMWPGDLEDVPHDLSDLWYDEGTSRTAALDLALRLYAEMPCYGNTMYIRHEYRDFSRAAKMTFWDANRSWLDSDDDRLADPIAYSLWVDYFEDPRDVTEAWREATTRRDGNWVRRLQRVLESSGPVPWQLKQPILDELAADPRWHPFVLRALVGSAFDVYGKIDDGAARVLLARLELPETFPDLAHLRQRLRTA